MVTAYGDVETKRKALDGGAEALFTKPIDFGMLRSKSTRGLNEPHEASKTSRSVCSSVRYWPKADMAACTAHVRF
jgi:DNA-binding response OmpR family regulator